MTTKFVEQLLGELSKGDPELMIVLAKEGEVVTARHLFFNGAQTLRRPDYTYGDILASCDLDTLRALQREGACKDARYYSGHESPPISEVDLNEPAGAASVEDRFAPAVKVDDK